MQKIGFYSTQEKLNLYHQVLQNIDNIFIQPFKVNVTVNSLHEVFFYLP